MGGILCCTVGTHTSHPSGGFWDATVVEIAVAWHGRREEKESIMYAVVVQDLIARCSIVHLGH